MNFRWPHSNLRPLRSPCRIQRRQKRERETAESCTPLGDGILRDKVHQHFGAKKRRVTEINEGDVEEEIVHGGMQMKIEANQVINSKFPTTVTM